MRAVKVSLLLAALLLCPVLGSASHHPRTTDDRVRHELAKLPDFSVFDNLTYQVNGDSVVLGGAVIRPILKSQAENVVRRVEGITQVKNDIEVLPPSPMDDDIRLRTLRAVYGDAVLSRYSIGANPPIHIIVKNGNVTLEGKVGSEMERNVANIRASSVPNVFSVTNNLQVGG